MMLDKNNAEILKNEENFNIVNFLEIKKDSKILLYNTSHINFLDYFIKKVKNNGKVISIERDSEKIQDTNIQYYCENIEDFKSDILFDYIFIIEKIEFKVVNYLKRFLSAEGKIFLITDNKFGVQYLAGAKYTENNNSFETIISNVDYAYTKDYLENIIKKLEMKNCKFYYPLPNWKYVNTIYSDYYLPKHTSSKLTYNYMYEKGSNIVLDEIFAIKQMTKENKFIDFCNSYMVELSNTAISEVKFVSYNCIRKKEYQLVTKIYDEEVIKKAVYPEAVKQLKIYKNSINELKTKGINLLDNINDDQIYSKYIKEEQLSEILIKILLNKDILNFKNIIDKWYKEIEKIKKDNISKTINEKIEFDREEKQLLRNTCVLKKCYIDMVFENSFLIDDEIVFFDQEWMIENIPLEYILYRAINNLYNFNRKISDVISKTDLMEMFGLDLYIKIFNKIEKYFQNEVNDSKQIEKYQKSYDYFVDINNIKQQIKDYESENIKKENYIKMLENLNEERKIIIENLEKEKNND